MSIEAMRQALEALEYYHSAEDYQPTPAGDAIAALRAAIEQAGKQEPLTGMPQCRKRQTVRGDWFCDCALGACPGSDAEAALPAAQQEPVAWMDVCDKGQRSGLRFWSEPDNRNEVALYTAPPAAQQPILLYAAEDESEIERLKNEVAIGQCVLRHALDMQKQEPVAWHHPDCEGECIACLIEDEVKKAFGTQGLDYLLRHVTSPPAAQRQPLTEEAKAVIDAARAAMDESVEAYDSAGSIKIPSHLAASLSLCLDEYDRAIEAAHGIGGEV